MARAGQGATSAVRLKYIQYKFSIQHHHITSSSSSPLSQEMVVEIIYSSGQYDRLGYCGRRRFEWNGPKRIRGDEIRLGEVFRQLRNPEKSDSINFSGSEYLERCESKRLKKWSYTSYVQRFIQLSDRHIGPKSGEHLFGCGRLKVLCEVES